MTNTSIVSQKFSWQIPIKMSSGAQLFQTGGIWLFYIRFSLDKSQNQYYELQ